MRVMAVLLVVVVPVLADLYSLSSSQVNKLFLPSQDNQKKYMELAYQSSSQSILAKYVYAAQSVKVVGYSKYKNSPNYVKNSLLFQDTIGFDFSSGSSLNVLSDSVCLTQHIQGHHYAQYHMSASLSSHTPLPNAQQTQLHSPRVFTLASSYLMVVDPFTLRSVNGLGNTQAQRELSSPNSAVYPAQVSLVPSDYLIYTQVTGSTHSLYIACMSSTLQSLMTFPTGVQVVQLTATKVSSSQIAISWVEQSGGLYQIKLQVYKRTGTTFSTGYKGMSLKTNYIYQANNLLELRFQKVGQDKEFIVLFYGKDNVETVLVKLSDVLANNIVQEQKTVSQLNCLTTNQHVQLTDMEHTTDTLRVVAYCPSGADDDEIVFQEITLGPFVDETDSALVFYIVAGILVIFFIVAAIYVVHRIKRKQLIQKQIVRLKEIKKKKKQLVLQMQKQEAANARRSKRKQADKEQQEKEEAIIKRQQKIFLNILENNEVTQNDIILMQELINEKKQLQRRRSVANSRDEMMNQQIQMELIFQKMVQEQELLQKLKEQRGEKFTIKEVDKAEQEQHDDIEMRDNLFISEQNQMSVDNESQPFAILGEQGDEKSSVHSKGQVELKEQERPHNHLDLEDMSPHMSPSKHATTTLNDYPSELFNPKTTKLSKIESKATLEQ